MKKSQGPVGVVIGLALLAVLLFVLAFAFDARTTGQVVSLDDSEEDLDVPEVVLENRLSEPFELRAWVVSSTGVRLDVGNLADEEYWVKTLAVTGCGSQETNQVISSGESEILVVECSLPQGSEFNGDVSLVYQRVGGGEEMISNGFVSDVV